MKPFLAMIALALLSGASVAQPASPIDAGNFTSDPLLRQYVGDGFQLSHALRDRMVAIIANAVPEQDRPAVPALPACVNVMRGALGDDFYIAPFMAKLRGLSPEERGQFARFTRFLHSPAGGRLLLLNRQAMAVSDMPDANGMPQLVSDHDGKMAQIQEILKSEPASEELPQAMFGLAVYLGGIADDPATQARFDQAQKDVMGSNACKAMQDQMQAYAKAHPEGASKP